MPARRSVSSTLIGFGVVAGGERDEFTHAQLLGDSTSCIITPSPRRRVDILRRAAEQRDLAGIRFDEAQPQRDRRGLAGAVGAEHRQQFAAAHFDVDRRRARCGLPYFLVTPRSCATGSAVADVRRRR